MTIFIGSIQKGMGIFHSWRKCAKAQKGSRFIWFQNKIELKENVGQSFALLQSMYMYYIVVVTQNQNDSQRLEIICKYHGA